MSLVQKKMRSQNIKKAVFCLVSLALFYHEIVSCVYSLELPHQGNSNECSQYTIFV